MLFAKGSKLYNRVKTFKLKMKAVAFSALQLGMLNIISVIFPAGGMAQDMPMWKEIHSDVRFWEWIFTRYDSTVCVLHDRDNLSVIYAAKRLKATQNISLYRDSQRYVAAVQLALRRLSQGSKPRNKLEERVWSVTPQDKRTQQGFEEAAEKVRCQRGVDLSGSIARSRQHIDMVRDVLRREKVPLELAYLPVLESGYDTRARSRVGALGLWQFMPQTARLVGLDVSAWNDHRYDARRSTVAAARLLREYREKLGSWPLAITAYNYGINGTARAVRTHGPDYLRIRDFHQAPSFGFAVKNYYPSFLAAGLAYEKTTDQFHLLTRQALRSMKLAQDVREPIKMSPKGQEQRKKPF